MNEARESLYRPPQATEVEKHVIGAMFLDADAVADAVKHLGPPDFYLEKHQLIFDAIVTLHRLRRPVDLITVPERLRATNTFGLAGGDGYLMEISAEVVSSANVAQHCRIIKEKAALRGMIAASTKVLEMAYNGAEAMEVAQVMERNALDARAASFNGQGLHLISPDVWIPEAKAAYDMTVYRGESTGWTGFDQLYRIAPAQTNVWTGIPGHGKSEFLDALLMNVAQGSGWRIGYFSPENKPQRKHVQKLAEKLIGAPLFGVGRMSREKYDDAIEGFLLDHYRFFGQGYLGATLDQVLLEAERITPKINALVIDPWNMLNHTFQKNQSETAYILECLRKASFFVSNTGISLHIVAHPTKLEEDFKTGATKIPGLYNISGSSHWFNAIDNGFTVHRNREAGTTDVHALKIRFKDNGETGVQSFTYDRASGRLKQAGPPKLDSQRQPKAAPVSNGNGQRTTGPAPAPGPREEELPF